MKNLQGTGLKHNPCQGCEAYYTRHGLFGQCVMEIENACSWIYIYTITLLTRRWTLTPKAAAILTITQEKMLIFFMRRCCSFICGISLVEATNWDMIFDAWQFNLDFELPTGWSDAVIKP